MDILWLVLAGALVGLAVRFFSRECGRRPVVCVIVGAAGATMAGLLYKLFGLYTQGQVGMIATGMIGAVALLFIVGHAGSTGPEADEET